MRWSSVGLLLHKFREAPEACCHVEMLHKEQMCLKQLVENEFNLMVTYIDYGPVYWREVLVIAEETAVYL